MLDENSYRFVLSNSEFFNFLMYLKSLKIEKRIFSHFRQLLSSFLILFALCLLLTVSCVDRSATRSTEMPNTVSDSARITLGTALRVGTLDPADAYQILEGILIYNLGDRLYTYRSGTTELVPQLARAMPEVSADGLVYKITLREDVTFHDGLPFNAEAMVSSLERLIENRGDSASSFANSVESIKAIGEFELEISLVEPFAEFPKLLTSWVTTPVSPNFYEIGEGKFNPDAFIGTGPYILSRFSSSDIQLGVNPSYWGEAPVNEGINIRLISSSDLSNMLQTQELDIAYRVADPAQIYSLKNQAELNGWEIIESESTEINYLTLNSQPDSSLGDITLRRAVAYMVDHTLLNDQVLPIYSLVPSSFDEVYVPVFQKRYGNGDIKEAKSLLTKAGFSETNPFTLEIWYLWGEPNQELFLKNLKEFIERNLNELVNVKINHEKLNSARQGLKQGNYPTFLLNWYPDFYDADTYIQPFMDCQKGSEAMGCEEGDSQLMGSFYYSDRAIQLIKKERAEQNPKIRSAIFKELQELLAEDVPYIPLWQKKDYTFIQTGVKGVKFQPTQQLLLWQISKL